MSDSYQIEGVTVTPAGGGYYDLSHPQLQATERVRGKETADARAAELAASLKPAEGEMEQQGTELPNTPLPPPTPPAAPPVAPVADPAPTLPPGMVAVPAAQLDALMARVAELEKHGVTTVVPTGDNGPDFAAQSSVPNVFNSQISESAREIAEKAGIKYIRIVLEESSDIPPTGLFVSHNGRPYMISPGEPVDVPEFLLGVLDDAKMSSPIIDSNSRRVLGYRDRMKYPYRRV
jgi:hypothetical protein